ncbi:class I SAM-dependent methyltransferase [Nonomuraea sp. KC401]|uniref:class I SAM-dependent methyltransferase n=1 Tax=unclassified Nonomuraea TaxID=2593643 RepID=UPI0010FDB049|nr:MULTISPECIES: class I SAM-dependent methyltransferase [unclassified Nonomuraea]NBE95830.1 methyltransferase domain-containing protein [Nonomuraea sp. K271]TLF71970.1 class I SAM-dependent methyltransferase [Nonomuraea sp. KC401]
MESADGGKLQDLLDEQSVYYRAVATEYELHALPFPGGSELSEALDTFRPAGSVLELACGPGIWTTRLLRHATDVTALDASPEMLALARQRVGEDERVRFERVDLFRWRPERCYDVVFFGFWLSHVPPEHFVSFWSMVGDCLRPDGRVFFVDDFYRTGDELIEGEQSVTVRRRLIDGTAYRIVKVPHRPADLQRQLERIGWRIAVHTTAGPFYWGAGTRA